MTERAAEALAYRRSLAFAALPTLLVPVAIGLVFAALGAHLALGPLVAGAVGWIVALALRAPVALATLRLTGGDRERAQPAITGASGPLEEIVRLVVLLLVGRDLGTALSIGLGWAAIECVYSLVNGVALLSLASRHDPEAEQARALLPLDQALTATGPWWGVFERIWASLLHVAFTLIVAAQPVLVVLTIVLHSATNLALLHWARRLGTAGLEAAGAAWTAIVLAVAVGLWRA